MPEATLIVAATPIGNLGDVSERLRDELTKADVVYAEDTRRTAKLLAHVGANPGVRSYFVGNEADRAQQLVADVMSGKRVVLVSDAGMPGVSDPGVSAIRAVREAGGSITVLPGPSAVINAVVASGFDADRFVFEGFLPRKGQDRQRRLAAAVAEERTVVFFASPNRLGRDLDDLGRHVESDRRVAIARELTKLHEEVWVGRLDEAVAKWSEPAKGEITVVVEGRAAELPDVDEALAKAQLMVSEGVSLSDAARNTAESTGVSRRLIYQALLDQETS